MHLLNLKEDREEGEGGDRIVPVAGHTRCSDGAEDSTYLDCILCDLTRHRGEEGPGGSRKTG